MRARPVVPSGVPAEALLAAHEATRALLAAREPEEIVEILLDLVRRLGGDVVPAAMDPADALPIDLGLGEVTPLLPVAPEVSVSRLQLDLLLPAAVEDARAALLRLRATERLTDEATVDVLTGVLNRRSLFRQLSRLTRADTVILFDLDHFKRLNDTAGHAAGDAALTAFGQLLRRSVRGDDVVGRYGGEEFLAGLIGAAPEAAVARVAEMRSRWLDGRPPVTFSAGVAAVGYGGARVATEAADRALYRAKAGGRDRSEVAGDTDY